jgi:glycosyltransferase involved in cell wall biosynthesis
MACGLPAYVTDIPGNLEWVAPGTTGLLFPPADTRALATLLRDTPGRLPELEEFGRRGRAVVEARADWGRNAPALLQAYDMALSDGRGTE